MIGPCNMLQSKDWLHFLFSRGKRTSFVTRMVDAFVQKMFLRDLGLIATAVLLSRRPLDCLSTSNKPDSTLKIFIQNMTLLYLLLPVAYSFRHLNWSHFKKACQCTHHMHTRTHTHTHTHTHTLSDPFLCHPPTLSCSSLHFSLQKPHTKPYSILLYISSMRSVMT